MPARKQHDEKLQALSEKLQDEHDLTEAEADLVARRTEGKGDIDAAVAEVIGERVGPAALGDPAPAVPSRPRLAPNVRLDEVEKRIGELEAELAALRNHADVVESPALRLSRQGVADTVDEQPGDEIPQSRPSDVDKAANAEKKAAEKSEEKS